jgi:hypothetical protein
MKTRLPKRQRQAKALLDLVAAVQELNLDISQSQVVPRGPIKCGSPHIVPPDIVKSEMESLERSKRVIVALTDVQRENDLATMTKDFKMSWTKLCEKNWAKRCREIEKEELREYELKSVRLGGSIMVRKDELERILLEGWTKRGYDAVNQK